jgi:hypothetical protein
VLPNELKALTITKLKAVRERVPEFKLVKQHPMLEDLTYKQIDGIINFISAKDLTSLWPDCMAFNQALDNTRNQSFFDVTPEFKDYQ